MEERSEHPLGRAVVAAAAARGLARQPAQGFMAVPGGGVPGPGRGRPVLVGSAALLEAEGVDPRPARGELQRLEGAGQTAVLVAEAGRAIGVLGLADAVRPEAARAGRPGGDGPGGLDADRRQPGDRPGWASPPSGCWPGCARRRRRPRWPGCADLGAAVTALQLGRSTLRKIRQNLIWALGYAAIGSPLAASGHLRPVLAGGAMALSSVAVTLNSTLLRHWRPRGAVRGGRDRCAGSAVSGGGHELRAL